MQRIFIVEDDENIARLVAEGLSRWGFITAAAADFKDVLTELTAFRPDLVLLDISLPYFNGYYWCTEIRRISAAAIVFLSSRTEDMDIVMAMQLGGDDYITKPFSMEVLRAKIQAVLRRSAPQSSHQEIPFCGAVLHLGDGTVKTDSVTLELTKNELKTLHLLINNMGAIVTREEIMRKLWDSDQFIDDNTLTVNMNRLRKKLESAGLLDCILTKRGEGYILRDT